MDAGCPPGVLGGHAPDEVTNLAWQIRTAMAPTSPGEPVPVAPETRAVPADDGSRLNDGQRVGPAGPETAEEDPEDAIGESNDGAPLGDASAAPKLIHPACSKLIHRGDGFGL